MGDWKGDNNTVKIIAVDEAGKIQPLTADEVWHRYQTDMKEWLNLSNYERRKRVRAIRKEARRRNALLKFTNSRQVSDKYSVLVPILKKYHGLVDKLPTP